MSSSISPFPKGEEIMHTISCENRRDAVRNAWAKSNSLVLKHCLHSCNKDKGCPFNLKEHILLILAKAFTTSDSYGKKNYKIVF